MGKERPLRALHGADPFDARVGARIRARRQELGLTQDAVASELQLAPQQMQKYERGLNRVAASRLFDMARLLMVEVAYFFDAPDPRIVMEDDRVSLLKVAREPEALRLNAAFRRIKKPSVKRAVISLVESIAALEKDAPD